MNTMIDPDDIEEYIETTIERKLIFYQTYEAEVKSNTDPEQSGRVLVSIHELGWATQDLWVWAEPEFSLRGSFVVPAVGDEVKVYFQNGQENQPTYRGYMYYLTENPIPETDPSKGILIHTPQKDILIKYDDSSGKLEINVGSAPSIILDTISGIELKTGDASTWTPCIIPNCIFSGASHGGVPAGIVKLTGS